MKISNVKYSKHATRAQTLLEYVVLVSIVAAVIVAMAPLLRRSTQAIIKVAGDQLAPQNESEQDTAGGGAYLVGATARTSFSQNKEVRDRIGGIKAYGYREEVSKESTSVTDLGLTNKSY